MTVPSPLMKSLLAAAAGMLLLLSVHTEAWAIVGELNLARPPFDPPCSGSSARMTPGLNGNSYSFSGNCWINVAYDKYDLDHPSWYKASVSVVGSYNTKNQGLSETVTFQGPSGPITIVNNGWCQDDPWMTPQDCTYTASELRYKVIDAIGMDIGLTPNHRGPLSLIVISPNLISEQLGKQESKAPRPPTGVDPVLWPVNNGKSSRVTVTWKSGDMSNNRWVMAFIVQTSRQKTDSDSAYSTAGQVLGLGPKQRYAATELSRVYVFTLPSETQPIGSYYFRVCAQNDADTQCSAPAQARTPTLQERAGHAGGMHVALGGIATPGANQRGGGTNPTGGPVALGTARPGIGSAIARSTTGGSAPTGGKGPTPLGTARPIGHGALGGARPAGGSGGSGSLTPAGAPPTSIGGNRPGAPAGAGTPGIAMRRPIGPVARMEPRGGMQPGTVAFPDLALGRGMFVRGSFVPWGGGLSFVQHPDATHTCPVHTSFRFRNAGQGPAQNVTAVLRDSQNPAVPVAAETLAAMAAGQSSSLGGVLKVAAAPAARRLVLVARVHEAGKIHEKNVANDHGSITLSVTCR